MFAAYSIQLPDLSAVGSTIATAVTVLWHVLGPIALLVVGVLVVIALVKNKGSVAGAAKTLESEVVTVEAVASSPAGKAVVADVEAIAEAVAAKMRGTPAPAPSIPNHPLVADVIDTVQKIAQAESKVANAKATLASLNEGLAAGAAPKA